MYTLAFTTIICRYKTFPYPLCQFCGAYSQSICQMSPDSAITVVLFIKNRFNFSRVSYNYNYLCSILLLHVWLLLLCIMFLRFIHVVTFISSFSVLIIEQYSIVLISINSFIHSSTVDECSMFQVTNNAQVQDFAYTHILISLRYTGSKISGLYNKYVFK